MHVLANCLLSYVSFQLASVSAFTDKCPSSVLDLRGFIRSASSCAFNTATHTENFCKRVLIPEIDIPRKLYAFWACLNVNQLLEPSNLSLFNSSGRQPLPLIVTSKPVLAV